MIHVQSTDSTLIPLLTVVGKTVRVDKSAGMKEHVSVFILLAVVFEDLI
jgi:hypothetical protein